MAQQAQEHEDRLSRIVDGSYRGNAVHGAEAAGAECGAVAVRVVPAPLEAAIAVDVQHQLDAGCRLHHGADEGRAWPARCSAKRRSMSPSRATPT